MLEQVCQLARNAGDAIMQVYDGTKPMEFAPQAGRFSGHPRQISPHIP
ncbi:cysQ protein [Salmonella bongori]|nr:cysQ protein [Salmonella bongori]